MSPIEGTVNKTMSRLGVIHLQGTIRRFLMAQKELWPGQTNKLYSSSVIIRIASSSCRVTK